MSQDYIRNCHPELLDTITIVVRDGSAGLPEHGPYDW